MSAEVMSATSSSVTNLGVGNGGTGTTLVTSSINLASENNQLWSIIAKQRTTIKELESALANLTKDRDQLLLMVRKQQPSSAPPTPTPTCSSSPSHEPVLPPRSPFRHHQQQNRCQELPATALAPGTNATTAAGGISKHRPFSAVVEDLADSLPSSTATRKTAPLLTKSSSLPSSTYLSSSPPPLPPTHATLDENAHMPLHDRKRTSLLSRVLSQPNLTSTNAVPKTSASDYKMFFTNMNMITIKVVNINLQQNPNNKALASFIISVHNRSLSSLWRIKKTYSDLKTLDTMLRSHVRTANNNKHSTMMNMEKLPDRSLFTTHTTSSTKVDQKKKIIEKYLTRAIRLPLPEPTDLIQFLSSDVCEEQNIRSFSCNPTCQKEGYLTLKKGQSGTWHTYYFMLHESTLDYYESKEGPLMGSITLTDGHMTVRRPPSSGTGLLSASDRPTLTITKIKRHPLSSKSNNQQMTLRMETETDLNNWVQALSTLAQPKALKPSHSSSTRIPALSQSTSTTMIATKRATICRSVNTDKDHTPSIQQKLLGRSPSKHLGYNRHGLPQRSNSDTSIYPDEPTSHAKSLQSNDTGLSSSTGCTSDITPTATATLDTRHHHRHQTLPLRRERSSLDDIFRPNHYPRPSKRDSTPIPHTTISTLHDTTHSSTDMTKKPSKSKLNRRTFWPKNIFSGHQNDNSNNNTGVLRGLLLSRHSSDDTLAASVSSSFRLQRFGGQRTDPKQPSIPASPLFGVPLEKLGLIDGIPVIVQRCIDFLVQRQAVYEEGIYRLSGSAVKIKLLKKEFEKKGDFDLVASKEYYTCDVHAVTGLLKLWLRELPNNILTNATLKKVLIIKDQEDCVVELGRLVSMLPSINYNLLRALCTHLLNVVQNSSINKMTLRNIGIVFSPTLGIPITIFGLFLSKFDRIFGGTSHPSPPPLQPSHSLDHLKNSMKDGSDPNEPVRSNSLSSETHSTGKEAV